MSLDLIVTKDRGGRFYESKRTQIFVDGDFFDFQEADSHPGPGNIASLVDVPTRSCRREVSVPFRASGQGDDTESLCWCGHFLPSRSRQARRFSYAVSAYSRCDSPNELS